MNNFLCLCFLCPLSCYFFPPGFLPFLMQISPLRLPHLSPFYVPPLSLVIIAEYCSVLCFGICLHNILQFVLQKLRKRNEVKPSVESGVFEVTRLFSDQEPHMWLKSPQNSRSDHDLIGSAGRAPVWCGWFRHMLLVSAHVLFSHSASHFRVDPCSTYSQTVTWPSDVNSRKIVIQQVHTNLMEEHSRGLTRT